MPISKPAVGEYSAFYQGYLDRVAAEPRLRPVLARQLTAFEALAGLDEARASHRYADGKWSVREVVGHLADAERIFAYRMLRIARGDATPLAGFDENVYVAAAGFERRPMVEVAGELRDVRQATLSLLRSFDESMATREGRANETRVTLRAIAWIVAGHAAHHLAVLGERYGVSVAEPGTR
ncbi:MAG: DinB family protein [Vicinamibacterales bacterium]|nr:DinB family protein [Vicinamibacterales bacterium]